MNSRRDDSLVDPDAPASEEEIAAAEELRLALEDPSRASAEADLARALSLAHAPREIPKSVHDALVAKSLGKMAAKRDERSNVVRVTFGAATILAIAAAILFAVRFNAPASDSPHVAVAPVVLVQVRSTAPLFHEPFDATTASARVDRIALARSDDLRENMYAQWGVK